MVEQATAALSHSSLHEQVLVLRPSKVCAELAGVLFVLLGNLMTQSRRPVILSD